MALHPRSASFEYKGRCIRSGRRRLRSVLDLGKGLHYTQHDSGNNVFIKPLVIELPWPTRTTESPMHAIAQHEKQNGIPHNSINKAIENAGGEGVFAKLERGELTLAEFYPLVCAPLACSVLDLHAYRVGWYCSCFFKVI